MSRLEEIQRRVDLAVPGPYSDPGPYGANRWEIQVEGARLAVTDTFSTAVLLSKARDDLRDLLAVAKAYRALRDARMQEFAEAMNGYSPSQERLEALHRLREAVDAALDRLEAR